MHGERDTSIAAAKKLGLSVAYFPVNNPRELDTGRERIAAFALQHKLPTIATRAGPR